MIYTKPRSQWLKKHVKDVYVKQAQRHGFRSRAAYKLLAIHEKDQLFKPAQRILDLGAAPGAWSQVAKQYVGPKGQLVAIDRLFMERLEGVTFIQGDLEEDKTLSLLYNMISPQQVDGVLSDMAPNLSGISSIDQPRIRCLMELALDIACRVLKVKGYFLVKCFHGQGFDIFFKRLRNEFKQVFTRKPKASKGRSSEVYLLAKGYRGNLNQ